MSKYRIIVGNQRASIMTYGQLEKGLGQGSISGQEITVPTIKRGEVGIPNRTEAWGARVIRDSSGQVIKKGTSVEVRDAQYKGEIEFLKWGDNEGSLIVCRYLKGYQTLDVQYQDVVLNAKANISEDNEASAEVYFLTFLNGPNDFDESTDKYLVKMLQIHEYNRDSVSKSPTNPPDPMFYEEEEGTQREIAETKSLNAKFDSLFLIKEAADDNSGKKLKNLFFIVQSLTGADVPDDGLYNALQKIADTEPDAFMTKVFEYKKMLSSDFEIAKSYNALDLTTDGTIKAGQNKKEVLAEGIKSGNKSLKSDEMLTWCVTNILDPKSYEVGFQLRNIVEKLK